MQWITALLAFATTMLIFAIIVSTFVELIHRVFKLRGQGMQLMLENLFTRVIEPHLTIEQKQTKLRASQFAAIIMENRAIAQNEGSRGPIGRLIHWLVDSSSMTDIPVEVFTQKLADSSIVGAAENFTDEVLQDIAQKYEAFGHEVSMYFGRRARVFSVGVAFVVVCLFYVHPYNIAVTYFNNPAIAQRVAEQAADTHSDYRALNQRLQSVAIDGNVDANEAIKLRAAIEEFSQEISAAQMTSRALAKKGIPIGWPGSDEFVVTCFGDEKTQASTSPEMVPVSDFCRLPAPFGAVMLPSILNIFWLMVGGLLVGLGAPFWAQAVSSLTATRDLTNRITKTVNPTAEDGGVRSRARGVAQLTNDRPTSVKTFNIARTKTKSTESDEGPVR